jgi:hypothetical protein
MIGMLFSTILQNNTLCETHNGNVVLIHPHLNILGFRLKNDATPTARFTVLHFRV